jgi:hypothetical protein
MVSWRKFLGLTWPEQRLLVQAFIVLPMLAVALRSMGLRRTQAILTRMAPPLRSPEVRPEVRDPRARRTSRLVAVAAEHGPYRANCLKRSLALWWLLRRQGIASELHIGIRKSVRGIEAHAWVEHSGRPLNDRADIIREYAPFPRGIVLGGANAS